MVKDAEDIVWETIDPDDMWALDKLILSRKLGYTCGPTGQEVPKPGWYIARPCVNMLGLGLGATKMWIEKDTEHLPLGYFWCEWLEGRHLSVDYKYGLQVLCVEGFKNEDTFTQWNEWRRTNDYVICPEVIIPLIKKYKWVNCEYIGGKLIELHFRHNMDFEEGINHFIPVWKGQDTSPPEGYTYRSYPDVHGRIGAFVK